VLNGNNRRVGVSRHGITTDLDAFVSESLSVTDVRVAFQPILDLRTREVFAYEALLRSGDPQFRGPLPLLEHAIATDCIGELGRLIRQLATEACPGSPLFLNIHPNEFEDGWLLRPDDPIFSHDLPVYLEITEGVPVTHSKYCHRSLAEIRGKGIRLAVDDLGAGYSNLKYIADLSPEIVKLDRNLTASIDSDVRLFRLVRAVVRLCEDLGAEVISEGIETEGELAAVTRAGVHYGQGYLIARPTEVPPEPPQLSTRTSVRSILTASSRPS
jgi:EAL domain-containing protein (putative c-di-GMP-specific phosphodiesterase class I)